MISYQSVTQVKKFPRNRYKEIEANFSAAIKVAYPKITIKSHKPDTYCTNPSIFLKKIDGEVQLWVPKGTYRTSRYYHTFGHGILDIEDARDCKLNLAGRPLYLLTGRAYNGYYRSLNKTYFLFGQNEDDSYFLHKVRPAVGQTGDLDACRRWMWCLKKNEKIVARQGDLAFISRPQKPTGETMEIGVVKLGSHQVLADCWKKTATDRYFALNPIAQHHEHHSVQAEGWVELRLAKAWNY